MGWLLVSLLLIVLVVDAQKEEESVSYWLQRVETVEPWWPTTRVTTPRRSIIFVKTHKTASSTVSSILHRYCAEQAGVHCFVPTGIGGAVTKPTLIPENMHEYNPHSIEVHAQHTYYWPRFLYTIVPEPAPIITLIRQPASRFLSTWDYRRFHWKGQHDIRSIVHDMPDTVEQLPPDFAPYIDHDSAHRELCPDEPDWAISNASEPTCRQTLRDMVSGRLELVLLTERLDEGLVLLSRSMGWPLSSVVYSSMKVSSHKKQHERPPPEMMEKIDGWLALDMVLYQVAAALLDRRIESQDASFWSELKEFQRLKEKAQIDCYGRSRKPEFSPASCQRMRQDNVQWVATEHRKVAALAKKRNSIN